MTTALTTKDLNIPHNATLLVKSIKCYTDTPALVAVSSGSSISISPKTSVNESDQYLLIGRQANISDIRINHKSISRKHAVLYFREKNVYDGDGKADVKIDDGSNEMKLFALILKDLGGKFGCTVNGTKLEKDTDTILKDGDQIMFGNVRDQIFKIRCPDDLELLYDKEKDKKNDDTSQKGMIEAEKQPMSKESDDGDNKTVMPFSKPSNELPNKKMNLTGRAAREAEIAAMMDSLDHTPTYTKFNPRDHESNTMPGTMAKAKPFNDQKSNIEMTTKEKTQVDVRIPISQSITIPNQANLGMSSSSSSLVTTLSLDPSGSRLLVGMSNATIRLYDFNGMDLSLQPFRTISIQEGRYSIVSTTFSTSGDRIIVGTTSSQPVILDRDGYEIIEFAKGDMYVTDMIHTDGHVANITGVDWHPFDHEVVLTASLDGSVRLWDLERCKTKFEKLCSGKNIYRIKSSLGKKTKVTCVKFSPTGREFACGTSCGAIQIWNSTKVGSRPDRVLYDAHGKSIPIQALVYSCDGKKLATRCSDDNCVKVWESRKLSRMSKPMRIFHGLRSRYECTNLCFSPDGIFLCVGTSVEPKTKKLSHESNQEESSELKIYDLSNSLEPAVSFKVAQNSSVISCTWHKKLNQIILGLSDGSVRIFYDPNRSSKGALLPVSKGVKKEDELSLLLASRAPTGSAGINMSDIQTPHALPMFRDAERNTKRKREKERQDPVKSKRPDMPGTGIKAGESTSAGLNFQQYNLTSAIQKNKNIAGKDPRNELFKYQEGKEYTKVHYDGDVKVLAEKTAEQEQEESRN